MQNENDPISIIPSEIRRSAERNREDAEMISNLCTTLENLAKENLALKKELSKHETKPLVEKPAKP